MSSQNAYFDLPSDVTVLGDTTCEEVIQDLNGSNKDGVLT